MSWVKDLGANGLVGLVSRHHLLVVLERKLA